MCNFGTFRSPSTPERPATSNSLRNSVGLTFMRGWTLFWPFRRSTDFFYASRYLITFCNNMHAHAQALRCTCASCLHKLAGGGAIKCSVIGCLFAVCGTVFPLPNVTCTCNARSSLLVCAAWSARFVATSRAMQCQADVSSELYPEWMAGVTRTWLSLCGPSSLV